MKLRLPSAVAGVLLLLGLSALPVLAGPVSPAEIPITQPDGSGFGAVPFGDEWNNGYETKEGYTIVKDRASGYWHYAVRGPGGGLAASDRRPGREAPPAVGRHLRDTTRQRPVAPAAALPQSPQAPGVSGTQPVLVLLVEFTDKTHTSSPADWSNTLFGPTGSVRQYYTEASYNNFTFAPAATSGTSYPGVVGWLNMGYAHPNTAANTGDANRTLVRDAIIASNSYVNYASFDTNGDGYISVTELHILVVAAGYETSYGGASSSCTPNLWAHRWTLDPAGPGSTQAPTVDGVAVAGYIGGGGYTEVGEWHCASYDTPGHMATIGVVAHELGHDISWPDLYDITPSTSPSSYGVGVWSVMSYGSWNNVPGGLLGASPAHPDAFLKSYQGWLNPEPISGARAGVQVQQAETNPRAIQLLDNPNGVDWVFGQHSGTGEYFLIENRQRTEFDAGLPGCGLLVWHIDETRSYGNDANATDTRRLVDLEEADGLANLDSLVNRGDAGDPYRGSSGNTTFAAVTNPNSNLYSGAASGVSVTNITAGCAATMSADFTGLPPQPGAPVVLRGQPAMEGRTNSTPHASYGITVTISQLPLGGEGAPLFSGVFSTDTTGQFTATGLLSGTYPLRVKGGHTLSRIFTGTRLLSGTTYIDLRPAGALREGDADGSNNVDILDFSMLRNSFGTCQGAAGFDSRADFNQDGCITIKDFSLMRQHFGRAGE